ncbi:hypothetical protein C0J52_09537 [Blattella germanica]|nr:hypothetical protein C0J52_09537 [Blattella germanica]
MLPTCVVQMSTMLTKSPDSILTFLPWHGVAAAVALCYFGFWLVTLRTFCHTSVLHSGLYIKVGLLHMYNSDLG